MSRRLAQARVNESMRSLQEAGWFLFPTEGPPASGLTLRVRPPRPGKGTISPEQEWVLCLEHMNIQVARKVC